MISAPLRVVVVSIALGTLVSLLPAGALAQNPPPPLPVDSTRLRIFEQLKGLEKAPGFDSTWLIPDSLLSDSALAERDARLTGRRPGPGPGSREPAAGLGGADSLMTALIAMEGYAVTEYASAGADFGAQDKQLVLQGTAQNRARLIREGEEITADTLIYSDERGKVWSKGADAIYEPKDGDPVNSARIVFDLNQGRGTATDAQTRYTAGADWILRGDQLLVSEGAVYGHSTLFTSCEEEVPHYHFAADNVKILSENNILVARPVKLYFADVPVMWLPFIATSTKSGRASGILMPTFSVNDIVRTSSSYSRRISNIGFYWAASDYWDATVALDWWSGEHISLTGGLQYEWARQFLSGNLNLRRFWGNDGNKNLAFDASSAWQASERTSLRFRARYTSSTDLVRRTSFDPREVVQSIDSEGGLSHRFNFGNLSLSGNRRQYLSDDRVEMTLPIVSFSLTPKTFFQASPTQAKLYSNLTWSGSANFRRSSADRQPQADSAFSRSAADAINTSGGLSTSFSLGKLSLSSGMQVKDAVVLGVPIDYDSLTDSAARHEDQRETDVTWNASLNYQQPLVGSSTITPSLQVSGRLLQNDTIPLANSFVSGPTRLSFGATLKTDLYGFFPGFGNLDAIRHKFSPSFNFQYAPEVSPTELQTQVFGAREVGRQKSLGINLNQTFEARLKDEAAAERAAELDSIRVDSLNIVADSLRTYVRLSGATAGDTLSMRVDSMLLEIDSLLADTTEGGAQAQREAQKVMLLSLQTSAVTYDFEEASESGEWLRGFSPLTLSNTISSDFLRGLSIRVTHELFEDVPTGSEGTEGGGVTRKFSPHLSNMNLGFSLSSQTALLQKLGAIFRRDRQVEILPPTEGEEEEVADPLGSDAIDALSTLPGGGGPQTPAGPGRSGSSRVGEWRASFQYSLQRPRDETRPSNQMIQTNLTFNPTEKWEASWRTSYDVVNQSFNDHFIRLTRNLHRWEAHFDFSQTATGNWSFRFEVALTDREELHFDYVQRTVVDPSSRVGGGRGGF
jgi:hypothetical protein